MLKKFVAMATLLAFLVFDWSCVIHTTRKKLPEEVMKEAASGFQITGVVLKSGEEVRFAKPYPDRVIQGFIIAFSSPPQRINIEIPEADILAVTAESGGTIKDIVMKSGKAYRAIYSRTEPGRLLIWGFAFDKVLPLSDIEFVNIKKEDPNKTFLANIGVYGVLIGVGIVAVLIVGVLMLFGAFLSSFR